MEEFNMTPEDQDLEQRIEKIVKEKLKEYPIPMLYPAIVENVQKTGLVDVKRPGQTTVLHNFKNPFNFDLKVGDLVYLMALNCASNAGYGSLTNSIIFIKA